MLHGTQWHLVEPAWATKMVGVAEADGLAGSDSGEAPGKVSA